MSNNSTQARVALVTGCGLPTGIGATTARTLAKAGIKVVVADVSLRGAGATDDGWQGLPSLVEEIRAAGGTAEAIVGDITVEAEAQRLVREAYEHFGSLDILVNNASSPQGKAMVDTEELTLAEWERIFSVNSTGTFLMSKSAIPYMKKNGWGRIINLGSMVAELGATEHAAFSASKAAVIGFTKALAHDVGPHGINVMAVNPMIVMTSRGEAAVKRMYGEEPGAGANHIPVRRFSTPQDLANVIKFLASDESGYLSGEAINVTGGTVQLNLKK